MTLDASIPLQSGKNTPDPLESAARIFTLKAAMAQAQMGDYKLKDQMTLRDVSALPSVRGQDGQIDYSLLLGEATKRGIGPDTVMTLNSAAQQQQQFRQQQQDRQRKMTEEFFTKGGQIAAGIMAKHDQLVKEVGPEKADDMIKDDVEVMRQQLQQITGKELPPGKGIESVRQFAMHSQKYVDNQMKAPDRALKEREVAAREKAVNIQEKKAEAGITGKGALSEDALNMAADQYLAGDNTAAQGYARNAQMKSQLTNKIAERAKAKGMSGEDVAAKVAEFQGIKAGERSAGTRTAQVGMAVNEAQRMIPLALSASEAATRSGIKSFNDIQQAVQKGTASPDLRRFVAANNSLVNVYSRAVSPTGTPTVSDKDHAREVLSTGFSKGDYKAAVEQLQKEMEAAQASPGDVRKEFRQAVTGKDQKSETKRKRYNPDTGKVE